MELKGDGLLQLEHVCLKVGDSPHEKYCNYIRHGIYGAAGKCNWMYLAIFVTVHHPLCHWYQSPECMVLGGTNFLYVGYLVSRNWTQHHTTHSVME